MLCVYIHVQSIQSSFILNFFYILLHSLKNEQAECGRLSTSLKRTIYTLMLRQYTNSIIALIRGSSQKQSPFITANHAAIVLSMIKTIVHTVRFLSIRTLSHDTRIALGQIIRNKSFKFVRKSQNFTVLTMLRISYGLPRVFYEFLRFFLESSGLSSE